MLLSKTQGCDFVSNIVPESMIVVKERLELLSKAMLRHAEMPKARLFVGNKVLEIMITVCLSFSFFPV